MSGDTGEETCAGKQILAALHLLTAYYAMKHTDLLLPGIVRVEAKPRKRSVLEDIPGVGPKRRRELLASFWWNSRDTSAPVLKKLQKSLP